MSLLEEVKTFKGINDDLQDNLIDLIISESQQRILGYINIKRDEPLLKVPEEIEYIVRDVSIKRYNKLNSEGATSDSEEGRSFSWETSYLHGYEDVLNKYRDNEDGSRRGSFSFI